MKTAKVFKNGGSQAVRLPKEYQIEGNEVYIHKEGDIITITPTTNAWNALLKANEKFTSDYFEDGREQPPLQEREDI